MFASYLYTIKKFLYERTERTVLAQIDMVNLKVNPKIGEKKKQNPKSPTSNFEEAIQTLAECLIEPPTTQSNYANNLIQLSGLLAADILDEVSKIMDKDKSI